MKDKNKEKEIYKSESGRQLDQKKEFIYYVRMRLGYRARQTDRQTDRHI